MKKKVLKIIIVAIMLMLTYSTIVSALSFTATMVPSSTTVAESKEFMITIKVSNLDVGQNGINALSGYLEYDKNIFEVISDTNIEGYGNWNPTYNASNGKITLTTTSFVKAEESVFQVVFKTKTGVTGKKGTISFKNIIATNSEQDILAQDVSTIITIGNETANTTNTTNTTNNQSIVPIIQTNTTKNNTSTKNNVVNKSANTTVKNKVNNTSVYVNKTNNVSSGDIPYTGTEDTVMYIMIVIVALSIIFYIKYQKINKDLK